MDEEGTTAAVQRCLAQLAGDAPAEPVIRALLDRAVRRLHHLSASLLYRSYPRLTRPPLNLQADELLGVLVERLLKALREARPATVRQFFALASQHMRWELNDLARRLDEQPAAVELREGLVPAPASSDSGLSPAGRRILEAIDEPTGGRTGGVRPGEDPGADVRRGRRGARRLAPDGQAVGEPRPAATNGAAGRPGPWRHAVRTALSSGRPRCAGTTNLPARIPTGGRVVFDDPRVEQLLDELCDSQAPRRKSSALLPGTAPCGAGALAAVAPRRGRD